MYSDEKQGKGFLIGLVIVIIAIAVIAAWSMARGSGADMARKAPPPSKTRCSAARSSVMWWKGSTPRT